MESETLSVLVMVHKDSDSGSGDAVARVLQYASCETLILIDNSHLFSFREYLAKFLASTSAGY